MLRQKTWDIKWTSIPYIRLSSIILSHASISVSDHQEASFQLPRSFQLPTLSYLSTLPTSIISRKMAPQHTNTSSGNNNANGTARQTGARNPAQISTPSSSGGTRASSASSGNQASAGSQNSASSGGGQGQGSQSYTGMINCNGLSSYPKPHWYAAENDPSLTPSCFEGNMGNISGGCRGGDTLSTKAEKGS